MSGASTFFLAALLALVTAPAPATASGDARRALGEGMALFAAGNHGEAARRFEEAASGAAAAGLDPATAHFDLGCALLAGGKGEQAAAAFARAAGSPEPALAASAHYNRGLALAAAAANAEADGRLESAVALLEQALGSLEGGMRIDPADEDLKANHEVLTARKARLEERLRDQARRSGRGEGPPPARSASGDRPPPPAVGEMRPDEARTLLDAMRQQETSQRGRIPPPQGGSVGVDKPW